MAFIATKRYKYFIRRTAYFRDDRVIWVAGDSAGTTGGEIIKAISAVNIEPPPPYTSGPPTLAWTIEPVADGLSAHSIVTSYTQVNYNAIAFNDPYDGFVGGSYSPTALALSASGYPYARLLNDQGGQFSRLYYFDRIGRLLVSQSTKQQEYKKPAYSYTLFDSFSRVIETGQKTENTDTANNFNKIFGDTIMNFYNPNVISYNKYLVWIKDNTGPRTEVTHTYNDVQDILPTKVLVQQNLRNRMASITYTDTLRADSTKYNNATHYSYDVHGDIMTLIQDDSVIGIAGQRYKRIDNQYDIVNSSIKEVDYQSDQLDQFHRQFQYDGDNRLASVYTSNDSALWDNDANYFYYAHGLIARIETGDQQVQGMDYAYTLQAWIKGVNSDLLDSNRDMGHDGLEVPGNLNRYFARDAAGYTLRYFKGQVTAGIYGDYDAINKGVWNNNVSRFEARDYNSDVMNTRHDLFNANISKMVTDIQKPQKYSATITQPVILPQGTAYNYDQLNRLIDMKAYQNIDSDNVWGLGSTYAGLYHNFLTYDANGNILTQQRNDSVGGIMSTLNYRYNTQSGLTLQNRLYHVNNTASSPNLLDIKDEGAFNSNPTSINQKNNYRYTAMGELAKDTIGGIDTIIWTLRTRVWKVKKYNGDSIIFAYDAYGSRILKEYKPLSGTPVFTYYINDADGRLLAIYNEQSIHSSLSYTLTEREIIGLERLGTENLPVQLISPPPYSQVDTASRYLGFKHYQFSNHLGNVLTVVSDRKIPIANSSNTNIDHYETDVISSNDYYPFGMLEPGRNFNSPSYRFGLGGKLKDDETYGNGNEYDFDARIYDPRLGRWMTTDARQPFHPEFSPYAAMENNPIYFTDPDGEDAIATIKGNTITISTTLYITGAGANEDKAREIQNGVMNYWGKAPQTVMVNGQTYNVKFAVNVQVASSFELWSRPLGDNIAYLIDDKGYRSNVSGGDQGYWCLYDPANAWAHEFGHFFGLADMYFDWKYQYIDGRADLNGIRDNATKATGEGDKVHGQNYPGTADNEMMGTAAGELAPNSSGKALEPQVSKGDVQAIAQYAVDQDNATGRTGSVILMFPNPNLNPPKPIDAAIRKWASDQYINMYRAGGGTHMYRPTTSNAHHHYHHHKHKPAPKPAPRTTHCNTRTLCCFIGGTKILMAANTEKNIEDVKVGDTIVTMSLGSFKTNKSIIGSVSSPIHNDIVKVYFSDGTVNSNTFDHSYFVEGNGWASYKPQLSKQRYDIDAKQLKKGDYVFKMRNGILSKVQIIAISEVHGGDTQTYNIYPKDGNNYFANGVLVNDETK